MKASQFLQETSFNQTQSSVRVPKTTKAKLIKELNQKFSQYSKSDQKQEIGLKREIFFGKGRARRSDKNQECKAEEEFETSEPNNQNLKSGKTKRDGKVEYIDINGNKFRGMYKNGIRVSGKMTYFQAKCEYEGSFFGQKFQGHGKLTYFDGRTIQGDWQDHFLIGNAIINYPNGDVYYGNVNQKLYKHGKGHLFFKNGDKYIGDFTNGSITGYGVFHKSENAFEGQWIKGELVKQIISSQSSNEAGVSARSEQRAEDLLQFGKFSRKINHSRIKSSARDSIASVNSRMRFNTQESISSARSSVIGLQFSHLQDS